MKTKIFGPPLWKVLHILSTNYPQTPTETDKKKYKDFYKSLQEMLPCIYCRESYKQFWRIFPIDNYLCSQKHLMYWVYTLHNFVNDKLRKQGNKVPKDPSFIDIYKLYMSYK